ncbi:MAG: hypothetical protein NZL95_07395 [Chitinophagales bacterium]|nr:hypothetical protein [Chitinophagales bacterium]MDW8428361.1 hypothetical protein [Chitinophagales bacterium]
MYLGLHSVFALGAASLSFSAQAQCCPYINGIYVLPSNPTTADDIKIVTHTTTPNLGSKIYYSVSQTSNAFNISACFWEGILTMLKDFYDTTHVGMLPAGTYIINYLAFSSTSPDSCQFSDYNIQTQYFTVTTATGMGSFLSAHASVHYNLEHAQLMVHFDHIEKFNIDLFTLVGQHIESRAVTAQEFILDLSALPRGSYLFRITKESHILDKGMFLIF